MIPEIRKVAVIGAGPSGLVVAKYLQDEGTFTDISIFEQRDNIGGVWNLTSTDPSSYPTPMYQNLESNTPTFMTQFLGQSYPSNTSLFPSRTAVKAYLDSYGKEIRHLLKRNMKVLNIQPCTDSDVSGWKIEVEKTQDNTKYIHLVDAVVVATGHQDSPRFPKVAGLELWVQKYPGTVIHSKFFRNAEPFNGKKVLIVGFSTSGIDIARQLVSGCNHPLFVSQRTKSSYYYPIPGVLELPAVSSFDPETRSALFINGSSVSGLDYVVCCTGFEYNFPFTDQQTLRNAHPPRLYQHIFHVHNPSLAFVGLPEKTVPWPVAEAQAAVVSRVWAGKIQLPSISSRNQWVENFFQNYDESNVLIHLRYPKDVDYMNNLIEWTIDEESNLSAEGRRNKALRKWGEAERSIRRRLPILKRSFQALGNRRSAIRTVEELDTALEFD